MKDDEMHLDVYINHSVLHSDGTEAVFLEGRQTSEAAERQKKISDEFDEGFYRRTMNDLSDTLKRSPLSDEQVELVKGLVDGITSEVGRALVGLTCLQLAIKSIVPEQSIRLHKAGRSDSNFSWREGISMRTLDSRYNTPFLREYGLLRMNADGIMMTRSLAENYPYSKLYKAGIRGPIKQWMEIVEDIESGALEPYNTLCLLLSLLKNRSDSFARKAGLAIDLAEGFRGSYHDAKNLLIRFFSNTDYSARAFEVVIHCFMQALSEMSLTNGTLTPLSQMRSANKKHGNIGDIELMHGDLIVEAWDAKYGKSYLRDELEELNDKLIRHSNVEVAGFIVDSHVDHSQEIVSRAEEISFANQCQDIQLLTLIEWLDLKIKGLYQEQLDILGHKWIVAVTESFGQQRRGIAPIDEPCDVWIDDLLRILRE